MIIRIILGDEKMSVVPLDLGDNMGGNFHE
jgi:hypothetical protein